MDNITLQLNSPITEDQWDAITDVDFENTEEILFTTKHKKNVRFVKAQQWIPCSERLPEYMNIVLVSHHRQVRFGCRTQHDKEYPWYIMFGHCFNVKEKEVIAWMPLPEPYREEVSD